MRVLATGESVDDQHIQVDSRDGQMRWLSANAEPLDDDGVIVTTADITQLKEQAQRLERQHDDLEAELEAVFERIDADLRFTYVNDRAETLLGHSESELLSRNSWQALSVPALSELRLSSSDTARQNDVKPVANSRPSLQVTAARMRLASY